MVGRQPNLPRFVAGGSGNPLGARALYLGHTVFRIYGTNQPETIGHAVSSGCFRLDNAEVIDLYDRVQSAQKSWSGSRPTFPDADCAAAPLSRKRERRRPSLRVRASSS
jgi:hypothetical protein